MPDAVCCDLLMNTPRSRATVLSLLAGSALSLSAAPVRNSFAASAIETTYSAAPRSAYVPDDITTRVGTLIAESGGKIVGASYGTSKQGRTLHLLRIGSESPTAGSGAEGAKPAILIVAGLNAQHKVGIDTALGVAKKLATVAGTPEGAALDTVTVYIMPCADPDGVERERTAAPKRDGARNPSPWDDDADGRTDEDGPMDLNGDGFITVMRVPDPSSAYGLEASVMRDPSDPRLTKSPDRNKGERPDYAILVEGKDQDGDGRLAEDSNDGTDLSRNFPYHWPEFQDGAGTSALCEPETRAIAEWVLSKPNLVGVMVYGTHDNIVNVPEAGKFDQTQRVPNGIENEDKTVWDEMSKLFKETTGMTGATAGDSAGSLHGWTYGFLGIWSFSTPVWVRPDLATKPDKPSEPAGPPPGASPASAPAPTAPGAMSDAEIAVMIERFRSATPEQRREMMQQSQTLPQETQDKLRAAAMAAFAGRPPEIASAPASAPAQPAASQPATPSPAAPAAQPDAPRGPRGGGGPGAGGPGGRGGRGTRGAGGPGGGPPDAPRAGGGGGGAGGSDADDAKWLKYSDEKRDKSGFIDFKPFEHPQLGTVEIGGWVPGFKMNPPEADEPALIDQQAKFITQLAAKLPKISADDPWVEDLGGGLWRIGIRVSNEGWMPTRSALGLKARRLAPLRIVLAVPEDSVLVGERTVRVNSLAGSGGSRTAEWTVLQSGSGDVKVSIKSAEYGDRLLTIPLKPTPRKQKVPAPPPAPPPPPDKAPDAKPADSTPPATPSTPATDKPAPKDPKEATR